MTMPSPLIDAYLHVGQPRFGSANEALDTLARSSITRGILVLGPAIPDLYALREAQLRAGQNIRCIGIPFGQTPQQIAELTEMQLRMGVSGMRFMPFELEPFVQVAEMVGEAGRWLFFINPHTNASVTRYLLAWLEKYPAARIAAPHFLCPKPLKESCADLGATKALLEHPRFVAILSRHGGVGSSHPYPHNDLRPWLDDIIELVGWERVLWGSEYPVLYWRNEQLDSAAQWLTQLGMQISEQHQQLFFHLNAQRLFFDTPATVDSTVTIPEWIRQQWGSASVPLLPQTPLTMPMEPYQRLLSAYLENQQTMPQQSFADFITQQLIARAAQL
jgi:hypothetical protein